MSVASPIAHTTLIYHDDALITQDFHIKGEGQVFFGLTCAQWFFNIFVGFLGKPIAAGIKMIGVDTSGGNVSLHESGSS
ncbi:putative calcium-transporting ATPase 7, plasma membrane-type [Camellia lanceoleosa]|uniref:Calcium-transporting ATPase 7, plasma membrane-type n=1 Tax=Camellia lanceoleosa TaxID=1840588 RepID=A0ACC0IIV3_9ERIC|nr:putative calcium-transporting ATPase 7, plasma membrane-type [Camellia lanceoleosa]